MKKLFVSLFLICSFSLSYGKTSRLLTKSDIDKIVNEQLYVFDARIDSLCMVHKLSMEELEKMQSEQYVNYYNQLDSDLDRFLVYMSILWGILGVLFGVIMPIFLNSNAEKRIISEMERRIKDQESKFNVQSNELKTYIDKINTEIRNDEKEMRCYQLMSEARDIRERDPKKAINVCSEVLDIDKENVSALLLRGMLNARIKSPQNALQDFNLVLKIQPDSALAYYSIGNVYFMEGQYEESIKNYKNALKYNPRNEKAYKNLGLAYRADQNWDKAIWCLNKSIEINPDYAMAYKHRAKLYLEKSKMVENSEKEDLIQSAKKDYKTYTELTGAKNLK